MPEMMIPERETVQAKGGVLEGKSPTVPHILERLRVGALLKVSPPLTLNIYFLNMPIFAKTSEKKRLG